LEFHSREFGLFILEFLSDFEFILVAMERKQEIGVNNVSVPVIHAERIMA
jgi:hypothetical protein